MSISRRSLQKPLGDLSMTTPPTCWGRKIDWNRFQLASSFLQRSPEKVHFSHYFFAKKGHFCLRSLEKRVGRKRLRSTPLRFLIQV